MEIIPKKANIVILAEAHNPSIISPEWLKNNNIITEEPTQFVHTRPFSMFESASFVLVVEENRWEISAKNLTDKKAINALPEIASTYVDLLPHIPYKSLGLNFIWGIKPSKEEELPQVNLQLDNISFDDVIKGHELNYGGIIYAKSQTYLLKLTIEKQTTDSIYVCNFNYHHDVKDMSLPKIKTKIKTILHSFNKHYKDSQGIINKLYT